MLERTKRRASHRGRQGSVGLSNGSSRWNASFSDEDDEAVVRPKASRESLGYDDDDLDLEMQIDALAKELDPTVLSTFTILRPLRRCCRVMFSYGASWSRSWTTSGLPRTSASTTRYCATALRSFSCWHKISLRNVRHTALRRR